MLWENGLPPNHTAGGINMNFFPLGPLFRRAGVFFIRRTFKDDEVYKLVLHHYIDYLIEKRFSLEWYIEGGRSRSGKLLPPKFGMLAYVVDAYRRGKSEDVFLIPVSIAYDQIQDVGDYVAEQRGAAKQKESFGWFLGLVRRLRRYGEIHIRFGEPISLAKSLGAPNPHAEPDPDEDNLAIQKLAFETCVRINAVTPISATSLVTLALLGVGDQALSLEEVRGSLVRLLDYVERRKLPTMGELDLRTEAGVARALDELVRSDVVAVYAEGPEAVYKVHEDEHLAAAYYRNSMIHFFVTPAIAELALLGAAGDGIADRTSGVLRRSARAARPAQVRVLLSRPRAIPRTSCAKRSASTRPIGSSASTRAPPPSTRWSGASARSPRTAWCGPSSSRIACWPRCSCAGAPRSRSTRTSCSRAAWRSASSGRCSAASAARSRSRRATSRRRSGSPRTASWSPRAATISPSGAAHSPPSWRAPCGASTRSTRSPPRAGWVSRTEAARLPPSRARRQQAPGRDAPGQQADGEPVAPAPGEFAAVEDHRVARRHRARLGQQAQVRQRQRGHVACEGAFEALRKGPLPAIQRSDALHVDLDRLVVARAGVGILGGCVRILPQQQIAGVFGNARDFATTAPAAVVPCGALHLAHDRNALVTARAEVRARVVEQRRLAGQHDLHEGEDQADQAGDEHEPRDREPEQAHGPRLYRRDRAPARLTPPPSPGYSADVSVAEPASAQPGVAVAVHGAHRVFRAAGEADVVAVAGLDLAVAPGEFVAILGPSGCGKSTLLRMIAGLETLDAGTIQIDGDPQRRRVAYVFQDAHLLPWRNVLENVALPLELQGRGAADRRDAAARAIDSVGLGDALRRHPAQLSGGMRMRVSLARALVTQPRLLLLDEPFAALDEITRQELDDQLRALWTATGMTVLFVTHSIAEAAFLAERAIVLTRRPARTVLDHRIDLPAQRAAALRGDPRFAHEASVLFEALERGNRDDA